MAVLVLAACGSKPAQMIGLDYTPYAHEHEPFAKELFTEHAVMPTVNDPEIGYMTAPEVSKRYVNVHRSARRTWAPPHPTVTVWFFGGSSMFGVGQRDDHTIPSEVAKLAHADGVDIRAVNYAESGWVRWQEEAMYRRLVEHHRPPDLVVFYDGINDYTLACRALKAGVSPTGQTLKSLEDKAGECPDEAAEVAAGQLAVPDLGVPVVAFLQPDVYTVQPTPGSLAKRLKLYPEPTGQRREQEKAMGAEAGLVDLSGALDGAREPLLFDYAHTNERGARVVAEAMWPKLRERLRPDEAGVAVDGQNLGG